MNYISKEFAEILGLLCAEGCHVVSFSSYWSKNEKRYRADYKSERVELYNKDNDLLINYKLLLLKEFNYSANITKDNKINIATRSIINKIIKETELGNLKWRVPNSVINSSKIVKISFIRGFFDGDGTIINRIRFFSTNRIGLKQVSALLNNLRIKHTFQGPIIKENRKPAYIIQVSEKERERFLKLIKPISKRPAICGGRS